MKTRNASPVVCLIHINFFLSFLDFFHFFNSLTSALSHVPDHLVVVKRTFGHLQTGSVNLRRIFNVKLNFKVNMSNFE